MHARPNNIIGRIRGWPRKTKIAAATGGLLLVGAIIAAALVLIRAPIEGSVEVPEVAADLQWVDGTASVSGDSTAECTATISGGTMTITMSAESLDAFCRISADARTSGETNLDFVIQDLVFTDSTHEVLLMSGGVESCGKPVDDAGTRVAFEVHYADDAEPGTFPAAADAGLVAIDEESYNDEACPRG